MSDPEPVAYDRANVVQKAIRRVAGTAPGAWLFARVMHLVDRPVHRLSGGRTTMTAALAGLPVVMLTTTGARSGNPRTVPLLGLPLDAGVAVIASNFGQAHNPGWCANLRAQPDATVVVRGTARAVRAREVEGADRDRIWADGLRVYPGWAAYERRTSRHIPVFVLSPRE
jgi:deazaflavin-dependent oxidoreductase (nitroreductase family)